MPRRENSKPYKVEVQKGPIRMDEQYTYKFCREPEKTMQDMVNLGMRQDGMTLTKHTPKQ